MFFQEAFRSMHRVRSVSLMKHAQRRLQWEWTVTVARLHDCPSTRNSNQLCGLGQSSRNPLHTLDEKATTHKSSESAKCALKSTRSTMAIGEDRLTHRRHDIVDVHAFQSLQLSHAPYWRVHAVRLLSKAAKITAFTSMLRISCG